MAGTTREQAMIALFNLLVGAYAFQTVSRRPMPSVDLTSMQMPALFLIDNDEEHLRHDQIAPAVRTITCVAWIFVAAAQDQNAIPATIINNIVDAIDPNSGGVLAPSPMSNKQTLGGLVNDCWIEGKLMKDPGVLAGLGFAHIPIMMTLP